MDEVEEALRKHPEENYGADEEGNNVDDGICPVLHRHGVSVRDNVEDPGLVGDGIELSDKSQYCKPNSFTGHNSTGEADDDGNVVDGK